MWDAEREHNKTASAEAQNWLDRFAAALRTQNAGAAADLPRL